MKVHKTAGASSTCKSMMHKCIIVKIGEAKNVMEAKKLIEQRQGRNSKTGYKNR